jgi:thioesterase domain-containing protein/acyl carrier protein
VTLRLTPEDRVAGVLPLAFAAGQMLVATTLLNGATLTLRDPREHGIRDLTGWIRDSQVSTLHLTPSLLRALVEALPAGTVLDTVRIVTTAGEKVYGKDVRAVRPFLPEGAAFVNWMGSSETEALTAYELTSNDPVPDGILPAGTAVPLRRLEILGEDGTPVMPGETGVLHVVSAHLAAGYWRDPEGTAAVFAPLPDGSTRFRSGDLARLDDDGTLHLLGRADDAVKIRGYLVQPQEVEAALLGFPEIADAVVRAVGAEDARHLVAWVVPDPQHPLTPSPASVRSTLARLLPAYMVPTAVVVIAEIPRNERGKVAVRELPAPPARPDPVPPATATERALATIWTPILRLDEVGRDESFTALGGDSLAVEEMLAAVESAYGIGLTTADLAEHPSLRDFAALIDRAGDGSGFDRADPLVRLRTTGTRPPLFCFSGAGGAAVLFEHLAAELGGDQPVYALQMNGFENAGRPDWTIDAAARRYVRLVQRVAPTGPVVLAGHSMGGLFALRVARRLSAQGREVALLALIDTVLPPAARGARASESRLLAAVRRSRPVVVGNTLYNFLVPTSIRRRTQERRNLPLPAGVDTGSRPQRAYWRTRLHILAAGLTTSRDVTARKDVFNLHGIGIAQLHRPRPWAGNAIVFTSNENSDDPSWWTALLPGRTEIRRIDASHVAVLRPPFVKQVVEPLRTAVDAVGER